MTNNDYQRILKEKELSEFLIENFPGIMFLQDFEGNYIKWNRNFEVASGYSTAEIGKLKPFDFFQEKDKQKLAGSIQEVYEKGTTEVLLDVITKDNRIIPFYFKARKINYDGKDCLIGTAIDMSDLQQVQIEIKKSESKYRSLFEQASDAIMVTDFQGNFQDVNESLCRMFGYTKEELMHMNIRSLIDNEQLKDQPMNFERLAEGHHVFSRRKMIHKDGTVVEVEANVKKISEGSVLAIARDITQRIKVENELAESENQLRTIYDTDPQCIKLLDQECRLLRINPAGLAMIEVESVDQVLNKKVIPIVDEEFRKAFVNAIQEVYQSKPQSLQYSITGMKGTNRFMEMTAVPLKNKDGGVICALVLSHDITARKKIEEAIRVSEAKYKLLFNKNPMAMWMLSLPSYNIIDVNDAALAQYGYSKIEFLGMTPLDLRPEEEKERFLKIKSGSWRGINNVGVWLHKRKNGSLISVEIITHDIIYEGLPTRLVLANDVSERLLAEEKLKESEFKFRKVADNEIFGIAWTSAEGKLIAVNNSFCKLLGYTAEELKGIHFSEFTHPEDFEKEKILIEPLLKGEKDYYQMEKRYRTKKGNCVWVELNLSAYRDSENAIQFFIGIVQNIHERKMAEEEIKRSHDELRQLSSYLESIREEERTNIAREIHDELGQMLTGLRMDASWLNKKIPVDNLIHEKIGDMISLIDETVRTVRRISTDLRPGILDDLGLIDAIHWQSREFERRTGIACSFSSSLEGTSFEKKLSTGIFRVFQETLTNIARHAKATQISTTLEKNDDYLVLKVADNGIGFDESEIRKKKTLGLVGMKERAKMFGGELTVQSSTGNGTVIFLKVPLKVDSLKPELAR